MCIFWGWSPGHMVSRTESRRCKGKLWVCVLTSRTREEWTLAWPLSASLCCMALMQQLPPWLQVSFPFYQKPWCFLGGHPFPWGDPSEGEVTWASQILVLPDQHSRETSLAMLTSTWVLWFAKQWRSRSPFTLSQPRKQLLPKDNPKPYGVDKTHRYSRV